MWGNAYAVWASARQGRSPSLRRPRRAPQGPPACPPGARGRGRAAAAARARGGSRPARPPPSARRTCGARRAQGRAARPRGTLRRRVGIRTTARQSAACMPASQVADPSLVCGCFCVLGHVFKCPFRRARTRRDGLAARGEGEAAPGQPVQAVSRAAAAAAGRAAAVRWRPPAAPPRLRADRACCMCAPAATSSCPTLAHGSSSRALGKHAGAVLPPASAAHLASCAGGCQLRLAASVRPFMQSPLRRQVRRVQAGGRRSAPARGPGRGLFPDPAVCPRAGRGPVRAAPGPAGPQLRWVQLGRQHPERGVPAQRSAPSYIGKPPDESAVEHGK